MIDHMRGLDPSPSALAWPGATSLIPRFRPADGSVCPGWYAHMHDHTTPTNARWSTLTSGVGSCVRGQVVPRRLRSKKAAEQCQFSAKSHRFQLKVHHRALQPGTSGLRRRNYSFSRVHRPPMCARGTRAESKRSGQLQVQAERLWLHLHAQHRARWPRARVANAGIHRGPLLWVRLCAHPCQVLVSCADFGPLHKCIATLPVVRTLRSTGTRICLSWTAYHSSSSSNCSK